jgi:serine/threonine protein kinase
MVDDNDKVVLTDAGIDVAGGNAPIRGRYRWAAAELLISGSDDVPRPTTEADIWSLACTIMEVAQPVTLSPKLMHPQMFTLTKPFPKLKFYPFVLALRGGRLIPGSHDMIPQPVWDLLRKCWALEPSKRPTAAMILAEFAALQA